MAEAIHVIQQESKLSVYYRLEVGPGGIRKHDRIHRVIFVVHWTDGGPCSGLPWIHHVLVPKPFFVFRDNKPSFDLKGSAEAQTEVNIALA